MRSLLASLFGFFVLLSSSAFAQTTAPGGGAGGAGTAGGGTAGGGTAAGSGLPS